MSIENPTQSAGAGWAEALESTRSDGANGGAANAAPLNDIQRVLDIPVQLSVELGRKKVPIKHVLQLAQGSLVELNALRHVRVDADHHVWSNAVQPHRLHRLLLVVGLVGTHLKSGPTRDDGRAQNEPGECPQLAGRRGGADLFEQSAANLAKRCVYRAVNRVAHELIEEAVAARLCADTQSAVE